MKNYILKIIALDIGLIELSPVIVFFITFNFFGFFVAALSLSLTTVLTIILSVFINSRIPYFAIFSGLVTVTSAFLTFIFKSPDILIIEDSVFNLLFFLFLFYSTVRGKLVLKKFFGHIFLIKDKAWKILQIRWFVFFLLSFFANEYIRIFYEPETWVLFKKYYFIFFFIFGNYQFTLSAKERLPGSDRLGLNKNN